MNLLKTQQDSEPEEALETTIAMVASALSDPSGVNILCALIDRHAQTATKLGTVAEVSASTISRHLAQLPSNGLMVCLAQGRHHYYRLADAHIAALLKNLMGVSVQAHKTLLPSTPINLRYACTCYDHLAGELAADICEHMLQGKQLTANGLALTSAGKAQLEHLSAVLNTRPQRKPCCPCLDQSEGRFHLGGDAGSALVAPFERKGQITRTPEYQGVQVTDSGRAALSRLFNLKVSRQPKPFSLLSRKRTISLTFALPSCLQNQSCNIT